MYELSHVSKSFVIAGKRRVDALKDVTIRFPDHGLVFIVGKSGAGKSTLLNLLGFFLKPDQGGFTYQGEKAASFSASKIRELRRDSIAFCFQNDNLDPDLSVFDNILLAKAAAMKAAEPKIHDLLISLDLKDFEKRKAYELSGGEQQRVAIARALWKDADVVLADEPTGALDSGSSAMVFSLLKAVAATRLVIVVSHDEQAARQYGDRLITLKDGRVISDEARGTLTVLPVPRNCQKPIHLPLKIVAKMGLAQLKRKPFQGILPALLLACSVLMACFSLGLGIGSTPATLAKNIEDSNANNLVLSQVAKMTAGNLEEYGCSALDQDFAEAALGQPCVPLYLTVQNGDHDQTYYSHNPEAKKLNPLESIVQGEFTYAVMASSETLEQLHLSLAAGRLPANDQEIAIPLCQYEIFQSHGYVYHRPGSVDYPSLEAAEIATPEEFLKKEPYFALSHNNHELKIVGLVDTGYRKSAYPNDLKNTAGFFESAAKQAYTNELDHSLHRAGFVHASLIKKIADGVGGFYLDPTSEESIKVVAGDSSYRVGWTTKGSGPAVTFRSDENAVYLPLGAAGQAFGDVSFQGPFYDWSAVSFPNLPSLDKIPTVPSLLGSVLLSDVNVHKTSVLSLSACTDFVKKNGLPNGDGLSQLRSRANEVYAYLYQKGIIAKPIDFRDSANADLLTSYYAYDLASAGDRLGDALLALGFTNGSIYGREAGIPITSSYLQNLFDAMGPVGDHAVKLALTYQGGSQKLEGVFAGVILDSFFTFDIAVGNTLYEACRNYYPSGRYIGGFASIMNYVLYAVFESGAKIDTLLLDLHQKGYNGTALNGSSINSLFNSTLNEDEPPVLSLTNALALTKGSNPTFFLVLKEGQFDEVAKIIRDFTGSFKKIRGGIFMWPLSFYEGSF